MEQLLNKTVGEIVKEDFRMAQVFSNSGIDFCCGGKISVDEACVKFGADKEKVVNQLIEVGTQTSNTTFDFNGWDINFLSDFIINTHHKFVESEIPQILPLAEKVANVHGEHHPEVVAVNKIFVGLAEKLMDHLEDEELNFFPLVKSLDKEGTNTKETAATLLEMEERLGADHDEAGDALKQLSALTNKYQVPEDACNTFRVLYGKLAAFEKDLHQHVHLENNVLFDKLQKYVSN